MTTLIFENCDVKHDVTEISPDDKTTLPNTLHTADFEWRQNRFQTNELWVKVYLTGFYRMFRTIFAKQSKIIFFSPSFRSMCKIDFFNHNKT